VAWRSWRIVGIGVPVEADPCEIFEGVPANRHRRAILGTTNKTIHGSPDDAVGITLLRLREPLGYVRLSPLGEGKFEIEKVVDAECKLAAYQSADKGSEEVLSKYEALQITFSDDRYLLDVRSNGGIDVRLDRPGS
jgi:hypothetical protein